MQNLLKYLLIINMTTCHMIASASTYVRLPLHKFSSAKNPSYFNCTVTPNTRHPTTRKFATDSVKVMMVNYAQMTRQFNGLGILEATARYINSYAFATYHDPRPL